MHRKLLLLLIPLFFLPLLALSFEQSDQFDGVWKGVGEQFDDKSTWTIKMTILDGKYYIQYPSLECGGVLTLLSKNSSKLEFHESIIYGLSDCLDNGKTIIKKSGENSAQFIWYDSEGVKGAVGSLVRIEPQEDTKEFQLDQ